MIPKDIDQIKEEDLQALKDNSVSEGKTIEYKQELPSSLDADKKEFLADVSSFANASGGDLIFGVIEDRETGTIESLEGLTIENVDQEILRLDNMIRDGIEPRIPSVSISPPIPLINSKVALVIRVPKSWISPHRVSFRGHDKFYSRSSNGKYPLDVAELRVAFNLSETMTERIRNFRLDRISKIYANETPVPFYDGAKTLLHLIPIASFNPAERYDIDKIASHPAEMPPIYFPSGGLSHFYNFDGFLTHSVTERGESYSYVQAYRNGIIEAVDASMLNSRVDSETIPSGIYEKELVSAVATYLGLLKKFNVEPPVFIFLTLLGVKGYSMAVSNRFRYVETHKIDRDILQLPEVILESYDVIPEKVLKPCFDSIWNACGFPRSFNYNDAGEWAPR